MKVTIMSQNVQGLNDSNKIDIVKNFFRPYLPSIDFLCLQEHKLRGSNLLALKNSIWNRARFYSQDAAIGNQIQAGCGGICTWVSPRLTHLVSATRHSRYGRALWVRLSNTPGGDVAILNVYASNSVRERCYLWQELIDTLPLDCRWILAGDWNFVATPRDKTNECGRLISGEEARIFAQLTDTLLVNDPFPLTNRVKFSWDNKRRTGLRVLARLDRIYSYNQIGNAQPVEEYFILGNSNHSDHQPVWCKLTLQPEPKRKSSYKMNSFFLKDPAVKVRFTQIWAAHTNLGFFGKMWNCLKFYRQFCIQKAQERRFREEELRADLAMAVENLQEDPTNLEAQSNLSETSDRLKDFENYKAEGIRIRSRVKWNQVGDACTKEFFQANRDRSGASHVTALEDSQGQVRNDQAGLEQICFEYYGKLYTKGVDSAAKAGAEAQAFACIKDSLTPGMKESLKSPLSISELSQAVKAMKVGRAPGPDGIILEFYKIYWDLICKDYMNMLRQSFQAGRLHPGMTQGFIFLLHKGGERLKLTNWRPITLLNISYKVLAKALQLRLQPVLMEVISFDQSAFLPMRFILDNILLTSETMAWAEETGQSLIFLKLDFSKAYDMVDWGFLFRAMSEFGFPAEFIEWTKLLFLGATASVKINGSPSPAFAIERGVRQGCPLAPYLFLIVAEVLNAMVKRGMEIGEVKGIKLPGGREQVTAQYADDTSFTLTGEEAPVKSLIHILNTFCLASGLVINWLKSCAYWKGAHLDPRPAWTDLLGIIWARGDEVSKLLGTPFGMTLTSADVDKFLLERINKKLDYWCKVRNNSMGRVVIVNSVLLSSTLFFVSIWGGTQAGLKRVKSTLHNYLWGGKPSIARKRIAWVQCCQTKENGGVNLLNPPDVLDAMMTKWILKACEPGQSNLHTLLRYRLQGYQPYSQGRWSPSLEFFTKDGHQSKRGSSPWNRVARSWRSMRKDLMYVRPESHEELLNESFWWSNFLSAIGPGFAKARATTMHKAGLKRIKDVWQDGALLPTEEVSRLYGLKNCEFRAWELHTQAMIRYWGAMLTGIDHWSSPGEWPGIFQNLDPLPVHVFRSPGGRN
jgi:exonuclease III